MNVKFQYLYRDGDNYKNYGEVVFRPPVGLLVRERPLREWQERILNSLEDGECFIAHQIGVPEVFLWSETADYNPHDESTWPADVSAGQYAINESDHCYHEFFDLQFTLQEPTEPRTIEDFLTAIERAAAEGWQVFTPQKRRAS